MVQVLLVFIWFQTLKLQLLTFSIFSLTLTMSFRIIGSIKLVLYYLYRLEIVSSPQPQFAEAMQSTPWRQMTVYTCCPALWTSPREQLWGSPTSLPTERWFKSKTKILHCTLVTHWFTAVLLFRNRSCERLVGLGGSFSAKSNCNYLLNFHYLHYSTDTLLLYDHESFCTVSGKQKNSNLPVLIYFYSVLLKKKKTA